MRDFAALNLLFVSSKIRSIKVGFYGKSKVTKVKPLKIRFIDNLVPKIPLKPKKIVISHFQQVAQCPAV